jgi:hypothetical protein
MKEFLRNQQDWLQIEWLPGCAPELNPAEGVWNAIKAREMANLCPDAHEEATTSGHLHQWHCIALGTNRFCDHAPRQCHAQQPGAQQLAGFLARMNALINLREDSLLGTPCLPLERCRDA